MSSKVLIILFSLIIAIKSQQNTNDLITMSNKLALDLLNTFPSDGNNFFSPLSITTALLMVMNGAKGVTDQEFRHLFNMDNNTKLELLNEETNTMLKTLDQKQNDKLIMKLANLLLVSKDFPIRDKYKQVLSQMFDSSVESVDFKNNSKQIIKDINEWVSERTGGKIKSIFKEDDTLSEDTPMILLNAIYFKGVWKYVFDRKDTKKERFYNLGDHDNFAMVDMMINQRNMVVRHSKKLGANLFEMPFDDASDMSMVVILPDDLNGLDSVTKKLTLSTLKHSMTRLGRGKLSGERLMFPKFKLETEYDLKEHLKNLGLKSLFEDNADLSGVNGAKNLKLEKAIHKAYIEVNEEGAEAAAVTKVIYALRSYRPNPVRVDRPFLFAIFDKKSSLIWFLGQIRKLS